jgi:hypothetical protein
MDDELVPQSLAILPLAWNQWRALRVLHFRQLAEEGFIVPQEEISVQPWVWAGCRTHIPGVDSEGKWA